MVTKKQGHSCTLTSRWTPYPEYLNIAIVVHVLCMHGQLIRKWICLLSVLVGLPSMFHVNAIRSHVRINTLLHMFLWLPHDVVHNHISIMLSL